MKIKVIIFFLISILISGTVIYISANKRPQIETKFVQNVREETKISTEKDTEETTETSDTETTSNIDVIIKDPGNYALLKNNFHVYQTFNNCGPATLSMALSWYGVNAPQNELASKMRPYQHPKGDNDDKTIFTFEFVDWAKEYGVEAVGRVNGDIDLIKRFISNGFPVVVKTWLKQGEDIGHFRYVTGYDEVKQIIYFDDSYDGPNEKMKYYDFLSLWQPFNYSYIVLYQKSSEPVVEKIIGQDWDEKMSYQNALIRAEKESEKDPTNIYPLFNISTTSYNLGNYERSVDVFEKVQERLPRRMLWYQIEPIRAYFELKKYDNVFEITDKILENGNRAFSELYMIRGEIYLAQGLEEKAEEQFELAIKYNENFREQVDNIIAKD